MPPVSTTPAVPVAKFAAGVIDTGGAPPVSTVAEIFASQGACTFTCEYLRKYLKKFETVLMLFLSARVKMIHEKILKKKSRDAVPLNVIKNLKHRAYEEYSWLTILY